MLILCEQLKKAYNSEYFFCYDIRELSSEYMKRNPEQFGYPYAILASVFDNDDYDCVLGSYSTEELAERAFVKFLMDLSSEEASIVSIQTEEHFLETIKNAGFTTDIIGNPF